MAEVPVKFRASFVWNDLKKGLEDANKGLEKLGDGIKDYGREQRTQARQARIFAEELSAITGSASDTTRALSNLGAAFLGGFSAQTAFDLIKGGVELWRALAEEEKKAKEEADKYLKKLEEGLPKSLKLIEDFTAQFKALQTGDKLFVFDKETNQRVRELKSELAAATVEADKFRDAEYAGQAGGLATFNKVRATALAAEARAKAALEAYIRLRNEQRFIEGAPENPKDKNTPKAEQNFGPTFGPGNDEGERIWKDWQAQQAQIEKDKQQATADFLQRVKWESDAVLKAIEDQDKAMQKARETAVSAGNVIGGALADAFAKGGEGAIGFGKVVLDQVLAAVQAKAVEAAATSAASVPFPLNVGLATAAFAFVRGMISQIPAREFGGPVYAGQPYLVGERGPEVVVPGSSGTVVPNKRLGGMTVNVTATDSRSFARMLSDPGSELHAAFRTAARMPRV